MVNLDTTDSHAEAEVGAQLTVALIQQIYARSDWEHELTEVTGGYFGYCDGAIEDVRVSTTKGL